MLKVYRQNNLASCVNANLSFTKQLLILLLFCIICGFAALYMGKDTNWDLLSYHYYNGFSLIHHRMHQDIMAGLMQTYLNPVFDAFTYLVIQLHHPRVTTFLLGMVSGFNGFVVYKISRKLFATRLGNPYSFLAVAISLTGAGSISLLGSTTNDTYSTAFVLTAFYFYLLSFDEKPARFYFSLSGLLIGAVLGLKLTNFSYFVGLNILLFFFEVKFTDFLLYWICCFVGFFIVDGLWMYQTYMQFGNPIFPYYNNFFHSPYISKFSFNVPPGYIKMQWYVYLLLPFYLAANFTVYTTEVVMRDARFAMVALLLLFACFKSYKNNYLRALVLFFVVSYVVWCVMFCVYRYILPSEMLSGVLIIALLNLLIENKKLFVLSLSLFTFLAIISTQPPYWGRNQFGKDYFAMRAPNVPNDAVIVLLSRPYTYVIPYLNPTAHYIGMAFVGLGARVEGKNNSKLYQISLKVLNDAAKKNNLYALGFQKDDLVTSLSYTLLLHQNYGPTNDCQKFDTNVGDHLMLCKLQRFAKAK